MSVSRALARTGRKGTGRKGIGHALGTLIIITVIVIGSILIGHYFLRQGASVAKQGSLLLVGTPAVSIAEETVNGSVVYNVSVYATVKNPGTAPITIDKIIVHFNNEDVTIALASPITVNPDSSVTISVSGTTATAPNAQLNDVIEITFLTTGGSMSVPAQVVQVP